MTDRSWISLLQCLWIPLLTCGPYACVQGRRATSKVMATSGVRLTDLYAWVTGRLTRRACFEVNLSLQVPPCKHYPEKITELKMATLILLRYRQRQLFWRKQIFRDRTNPLGKFNDLELFWKLDSDKRIFSKWQTNWKRSLKIWTGRACYFPFPQAREQRWIFANNEHQ